MTLFSFKINIVETALPHLNNFSKPEAACWPSPFAKNILRAPFL